MLNKQHVMENTSSSDLGGLNIILLKNLKKFISKKISLSNRLMKKKFLKIKECLSLVAQDF